MKVWYPDAELLLEIHEKALKEFGGYPGLAAGLQTFHSILRDVKLVKGIYRKAAILLRRLRTDHVFHDANKRTAYTITKTFLEMNGESMWTKDPNSVYKFIKGLMRYDIDDIAEWLKNGPKEEGSKADRRKDLQRG